MALYLKILDSVGGGARYLLDSVSRCLLDSLRSGILSLRPGDNNSSWTSGRGGPVAAGDTPLLETGDSERLGVTSLVGGVFCACCETSSA